MLSKHVTLLSEPTTNGDQVLTIYSHRAQEEQDVREAQMVGIDHRLTVRDMVKSNLLHISSGKSDASKSNRHRPQLAEEEYSVDPQRPSTGLMYIFQPGSVVQPGGTTLLQSDPSNSVSMMLTNPSSSEAKASFTTAPDDSTLSEKESTLTEAKRKFQYWAKKLGRGAKMLARGPSERRRTGIPESDQLLELRVLVYFRRITGHRD